MAPRSTHATTNGNKYQTPRKFGQALHTDHCKENGYASCAHLPGRLRRRDFQRRADDYRGCDFYYRLHRSRPARTGRQSRYRQQFRRFRVSLRQSLERCVARLRRAGFLRQRRRAGGDRASVSRRHRRCPGFQSSRAASGDTCDHGRRFRFSRGKRGSLGQRAAGGDRSQKRLRPGVIQSERPRYRHRPQRALSQPDCGRQRAKNRPCACRRVWVDRLRSGSGWQRSDRCGQRQSERE